MTDTLTMRACPFCGGEPQLAQFSSAFTVHCANVDCAVNCETSASDAAAAVEAWNSRPLAIRAARKPAPTVDEIAKALWAVTNRWQGPDYPGKPERLLEKQRDETRAMYEQMASAVLALLPQKAQGWQPPDGWALVPLTATADMASAWELAYNSAPQGSGHSIAWEDAYDAMIAAAPTLPSGK